MTEKNEKKKISWLTGDAVATCNRVGGLKQLKFIFHSYVEQTFKSRLPEFYMSNMVSFLLCRWLIATFSHCTRHTEAPWFFFKRVITYPLLRALSLCSNQLPKASSTAEFPPRNVEWMSQCVTMVVQRMRKIP